MSNYVCCFCGETIKNKTTALLVVTNWTDNNEDNQESQQFFCHLDCFKKTLRNEEYLYIDEE